MVKILSHLIAIDIFRGENQQYLKSVPSLRRKQEGKSKYECELIKVIAVMRSFQFLKFIWKIDVVPFWEAKLSDINIDALAGTTLWF